MKILKKKKRKIREAEEEHRNVSVRKLRVSLNFKG